jgi:putative tryptophan/tyrosine transport system substrate-binding protein
MRRREFIAGVGSAVALPFAAHAQHGERMRRVGVLFGLAEGDAVSRAMVATFGRGLEHFGWIEGRNLRIEYRFAAGNTVLYKNYAAELVGLSPDVILANASVAVEALKPLTRSIPIIFTQVADPIGQGFVQSLAHPGGNITGFSTYDPRLMGKWLGLLREIAPNVTRIAVVYNPDTTPFSALYVDSIKAAASMLRMTVSLALVHNDMQIDNAAADLAQTAGGALVILVESFTITHRDTIVVAAGRYRLPAIGLTDAFPKAGGLMSYWMDTIEMHAQAATYVDRILRGDRPGNLPVQQPTKLELVINLKTARALGLTIPPNLLALADEVIE